MIQTLKRLLKAKYDVNKDEIVGAREGSLVWHHEDRHRQQFQDFYLREIMSWLNVLLVAVGTVFIAHAWSVGRLYAGFTVAGMAATPLIAVNLLIEADAWQYSIRKFRNNSEGDR